MAKLLVSLARLAALAVIAATPAAAWAQAEALEEGAPDEGSPDLPGPYGPPQAGESPRIPPHVEGRAIAYVGNTFCYVGAHPADARADGRSWDDASGQHTHQYPPVDLRLFAFRDGCYYFIGDPQDFGYRGQTWSYYGAHPILENHGGGWCFMIGGHGHFWQPWSPHFTVVGSWNYWQGPYDPFFWSYWPYYSFYYRSHYPHYYAGGRYGRGRNHHVAPAITRVPPSAYAGHGWRATPPDGTTTGAPNMAGPRSPARGVWGGWRVDPAYGAPASGAPASGARTGGGNRPGGWVAPAAPAGGGARGSFPGSNVGGGGAARAVPAAPSTGNGGGGALRAAPGRGPGSVTKGSWRR